MTNAELIKALRNCSSPTVGSCMDCPYYKGVSCKWQMMEDAADALEAAEKRIAELSLDCEMYQQKCMELEAQLPKEGEWIYTPLERYKEYKVKCPFCGAEYHDCYDGYIDAEDMNYCPNCGCRMDGETK